MFIFALVCTSFRNTAVKYATMLTSDDFLSRLVLLIVVALENFTAFTFGCETANTGIISGRNVLFS